MSSKPPNPTSPDPKDFDPDHPVSPSDAKDRLGFKAVAGDLARSLLAQPSGFGLVMSIEGQWGSGKSSLLNFLVDELESVDKLEETKKTTKIVRFEPWLVGKRDAMLGELMSGLAAAVETSEDSDKTQGKELKKKAISIAKQLRQYGSKLSRFEPLANLAGDSGVPYAREVANFLKRVAKVKDKPLSEIKKELTNDLSKLSRRIVVIIDDLDRLEPDEAAEIMRLVRAVADFPNVFYILCYDPGILAENLEKSLSLKDGATFLEKMIQISFKVPQPEAFDLRRWFWDECWEFYKSTSSEKELSENVSRRLQEVCDLTDGLLKTPRDVIRVTNAIKLYWPPISEKVNYPDLVYLQVIRLQSRDLYSWIERYLNEWFAALLGDLMNNADTEKFSKELKGLLSKESLSRHRWRRALEEFVPGIGSKIADGGEYEEYELFKFNKDEIEALESNRRLGSPQHGRYYFAFAKSEGALDDAELQRFIESARSGGNLEKLFSDFFRQKRPQGGNKFDVLMYRLKNLAKGSSLPDDAIPLILKALGNFMDEAGHEDRSYRPYVRGMGISGSIDWFGKLFTRLPNNEERANILGEIFTSGKAIGWLMGGLIRSQLFAQGRLEPDEAEAENEWIFTEDELDRAIELLLNRFKTTDRAKIIDVPNALGLMYDWLESGDAYEVREWVGEQSETDAKFLKFLNKFRPLSRGKGDKPREYKWVLKDFMDVDKTFKRLQKISNNQENTESERKSAKELLQDIQGLR